MAGFGRELWAPALLATAALLSSAGMAAERQYPPHVLTPAERGRLVPRLPVVQVLSDPATRTALERVLKAVTRDSPGHRARMERWKTVSASSADLHDEVLDGGRYAYFQTCRFDERAKCPLGRDRIFIDMATGHVALISADPERTRGSKGEGRPGVIQVMACAGKTTIDEAENRALRWFGLLGDDMPFEFSVLRAPCPPRRR